LAMTPVNYACWVDNRFSEIMLKLCSIVFVKIKMKHCDYVKPAFDIRDAHNGLCP
jgi:hypothetical protein